MRWLTSIQSNSTTTTTGWITLILHLASLWVWHLCAFCVALLTGHLWRLQEMRVKERTWGQSLCTWGACATNWANGHPTFVVLNQTSQKQWDGLLLNLVQTFIFPSGCIVIIFMIPRLFFWCCSHSVVRFRPQNNVAKLWLWKLHGQV